MTGIILWFGGQSEFGFAVPPVMTSGGAVTVMVCVSLALLLAASVAVQVIVVVPSGNGAPSGWPSLRTVVTVTPVHGPEVTGEPGSTTAVQLAPAVTVMSSGAVIAGGLLSVTVTCWMAAALLPCPSFAV